MVFASSKPHLALSALDEAESYLKSVWQLQIKPSSKLWMPSFQSDQDFECEGWSKVTAFPILGHLIAADGAVNPCIDQALAAAWRAFWRFVRQAGVSALSTALRLRQINILYVWFR